MKRLSSLIDPAAIDYTAHIADGDSGALIFPDIEMRLSAALAQGEISVDRVYLRDYNQRDSYMNADASCDPFVQRLAAIIREQALNDDDFIAEVHEKQDIAPCQNSYIRQHRLTPKDVL